MSGEGRNGLVFGILLIVTIVIAPAAAATTPGEANNSTANDSTGIIAVFHTWVEDPQSAASEVAQANRADLRFVYQHAIRGFAAEIPANAARGIERDPRVAYIEPDIEVQTFGDIPTGVDRIEADTKLNLGDESVSYDGDIDIAILDTGIDENHPALNVAGGTDCTQGNPVNVTCRDGMTGDGHGHGTHVAGTAAGKDGFGAVGVAPGADLWSIKVLGDDGGGRMSQIIAGVDWVTDHADRIDVANMSLGGSGSSSALDSALTSSANAGVVYAVAAGNSDANVDGYTPAGHPDVITVSAMADFDGIAGGAADPTCRDDVGEDDTYALFSNYGEDVDLIAPGVCIESAIPGGGYDTFSGTSMASPHVAGAAALYITEHSVDSWEEVRDGLINNWSVAQTDECGLVDHDSHGKTSEPMLMLDDCTIADDDNGTDPEPATGTLTGAVTDADSGDGIQDALVEIEDTDHSATTGSNGSYTIEDVETGEYSVIASADGYEFATETDVTVAEGETTIVDFSLDPISQDDDDAEIGDPVISDWSVSTRSTGPWSRADVTWEVSHPDGALHEVTTELLDGDTVVDSQTSSVSGNSASGEHELRTRGDADAVRITVTDSEGTSVTDTQAVFQ